MARLCGTEIIRQIDFVFFAEKEIRAAVIDARNRPSGGTTGGSNGHAFISDPTAMTAMRNTAELKSIVLRSERKVSYPERWLAVIERTYCACDDIKKQVAKRHYQGEHYGRTCRELAITQSTYSYLLNDVRHFAVMCAIQMGLIRVM